MRPKAFVAAEHRSRVESFRLVFGPHALRSAYMTCKRCGHRLFAVGDLELHQQVLYGMHALNAARRCRSAPFLLCLCCFCNGAHSKHVRAYRRAMATSSATANKSRCTARGHRSNRERPACSFFFIMMPKNALLHILPLIPSPLPSRPLQLLLLVPSGACGLDARLV